MKYKVGVIGRFGFGKTLLNGQTIKTKSLVAELGKKLGEENILLVDTYGGIKTMLKLPFQCFHAAMRSANIIIMPARNGIRAIAPLLTVLSFFFHRKLHYVVIGGWLTNLLNDKPFLTWCLKQFDWIYAETSSMQKKLEENGFRNVVRMPNFKELQILDESELVYHAEQTYRLCTFSRVMKEKGIETAIKAVGAVNSQLNKTIYQLDIYGQVDTHQHQWFQDLQEQFPPYIRYCGEVPFDESVSVLREYDALLFPTEFYTEGIPGTIIDAYAAGVPVIASMWENYSDIINEETGIGYGFDDPWGLPDVLLSLSKDALILKKMKSACLHSARNFTPEAVFPILLSRLEDNDEYNGLNNEIGG